MSTDLMDVDLQVDTEDYRDALRRTRSAATVAAASAQLARQRDVARDLGVSDSVVDQWRARSAQTGFPDPVACQFGRPKGGGRRGAYLWDLEAVRRWHAWFRLPRNVRRITPKPE